MASRAALREIYEAALARYQQDRRNKWHSYTEAERRQAWVEGRELPRMDLYAPEYRPPETAAEFFDDRIIEWGHRPGFPEAPVLIEVAAAARESAEAAVQAVRAARRLDRRIQWVIYQNLLSWKQHSNADRTGADRTARAVLAEWSRLGLPEEDPDDE
jgi:hypothetical protein